MGLSNSLVVVIYFVVVLYICDLNSTSSSPTIYQFKNKE